MMRVVAPLAAITAILSAPLAAQRSDDIAEQRLAVEAWTTCIADEKPGEVERLLQKDFRETSYKTGMKMLAQERVSKSCFDAMPRKYRRVELGGLPFAGGLAERMIEKDDAPLLTRLMAASEGPEPQTFSFTDKAAMCVARGAPQHVAILFDTDINSGDELKALAGLQPILDACTPGDRRIEASAMGLRSMLATATYRLLSAQKANNDA